MDELYNDYHDYGNPYFSGLGLTLIGEAKGAEYFSHDRFIVLHDANQVLFWAHSIGCSCTFPFEGIESLSDFNSGSLKELLGAIRNWWTEDDTRYTESLRLKEEIRKWKKEKREKEKKEKH